MQAHSVGPAQAGLKERIIEFVGPASVELTSHEKDARRALSGLLPPGASVYVTHTPNSTIGDVASVACEVESWGYKAFPHIVARRIQSVRSLTEALGRLRDAGITRALLVAGDLSTPTGMFTSTQEILATGAFVRSGFTTLGVAGHPEGHSRIGPTLLWSALRDKQEYAELTGTHMHIVSQFGFDPGAIARWEAELTKHGITLPVHVGIAGPASLRTLIKYAILCGIGASLSALMRNLSALSSMRHLATTADEILMQIVCVRDGPVARRIVQPHFFSFGGVAPNVRWLHAIQSGNFDVDLDAGTLVVRIDGGRRQR